MGLNVKFINSINEFSYEIYIGVYEVFLHVIYSVIYHPELLQGPILDWVL